MTVHKIHINSKFWVNYSLKPRDQNEANKLSYLKFSVYYKDFIMYEKIEKF